jgi:hydrogenase expression/formation protein HypC
VRAFGSGTGRQFEGEAMCLGIPGQLTEIFEEQTLRMGKVRFSGVSRSVCLELVPDAQCGDFVLVHVGFALERIDPLEAARLTELLNELAASQDGAPPAGEQKADA